MDTKSKDTVFSVILIALGAYVLWEGTGMVARASRPPFNITHFRISPGMLPVMLGGALIFFSLLLLIGSLRGQSRPLQILAARLKSAAASFRCALGEADMQSMIVSVIIMAVYTFIILGRVPFWLGSVAFLVGLMLFLRAGRLWVIVAASGASVALIIVLFENFFKTILP